MKIVVSLIVLVASIYSAKAQHCKFDGSIALVLDIRNEATSYSIPNLDVKIVDKDLLHYYQTSWTYTKSQYPVSNSTYMRFTYITLEMIREQNLPTSLKNKYVLWLSPQTYRNASTLNLSKKLYLTDKAAINIKKQGLIESVKYIDFLESTLFSGCTSSALWKTEVSQFHTIYFTEKEIEKMEKLR